jgi:hypothetical protein
VAKSIRLVGDTQRAYAHRCIDEAPLGHVVKIAEETRRDRQNRKLWPMLADIRRQVPGMEEFTDEDMKLRFMDALGEELRFLPKLYGQGFFPVGHRSSELTVQQFAGLIELLYKFGAEHGVAWSEPEASAA